MTVHFAQHRVRAALALTILSVALLGVALQSTADAQQRYPFATRGDRPHVSSTPPPEMSAHGWWVRFSGPATRAKVTIQLQQRTGGGYVNVGRRGVQIVGPGGGAGNRATARARCHVYKGGLYTYRSVIDVDIIGFNDTPEKTYKTATTACSVLGRDA